MRFRERTIATLRIAKHRTTVGTVRDEKLGACVVLTMHGPKGRIYVETNDALSVKGFAREIEDGLAFYHPNQRKALKRFCDALTCAASHVLRWNHGP